VGNSLVLGAIAAIVAALAAATLAFAPSPAEKAERAYRACVALAPHPPSPWPVVTHDLAARQRAQTLLEYQESCSRSSGVQMVVTFPIAVRLAIALGKTSKADGRVAGYQKCMGIVTRSHGTYERVLDELNCGGKIGGLMNAQVEMASGYNFSPYQAPRISTATRFPKLAEHVREGTWWWDVCK
jgi:hypothetical protein